MRLQADKHISLNLFCCLFLFISTPNVMGSELCFYPVSPKPFFMGHPEEVQIETTLGQPFCVGNRKVSQDIWVDIMGDNPSHHLNGRNKKGVKIDGKYVQLLSGYPVENMTWWSALEFTNRISKRYGLDPTYDFRDIIFEKGTSAANGSLQRVSGDLRINSKSIYEHSGIRLPTEAEQEFLLTRGGCQEIVYPFGNNPDSIDRFATIRNSSDHNTQPLNVRKYIKINNRPFYELTGNVQEWSSDLYYYDLLGGINPERPFSSKPVAFDDAGEDSSTIWIVVRGSDYMSSLDEAQSHAKRAYIKFDANDRYPFIGVRLVHSLLNNK